MFAHLVTLFATIFVFVAAGPPGPVDLHLTTNVSSNVVHLHFGLSIVSLQLNVKTEARFEVLPVNETTNLYHIPLSRIEFAGRTLSGTINVTTVESDWTQVKVSLQAEDRNKENLAVDFVLHKTTLPSFESKSKRTIVRYIGNVFAALSQSVTLSYWLKMERESRTDNQRLCPWIELEHSLETNPKELLHFHSKVDHQCNGKDEMLIKIETASSLWPLANFNLVQHFEFGDNGNEICKVVHPLLQMVITGLWSPQIYQKKLELTSGQLVPAKVEVSLNWLQNKDKHSILVEYGGGRSWLADYLETIRQGLFQFAPWIGVADERFFLLCVTTIVIIGSVLGLRKF